MAEIAIKTKLVRFYLIIVWQYNIYNLFIFNATSEHFELLFNIVNTMGLINIFTSCHFAPVPLNFYSVNLNIL